MTALHQRQTTYRSLQSHQSLSAKKAAAKNQFAVPNAVSLIDTTYFGRNFGIMVLYDGTGNQVLSVNEVEYETNARYLAAVQK